MKSMSLPATSGILSHSLTTAMSDTMEPRRTRKMNSAGISAMNSSVNSSDTPRWRRKRLPVPLILHRPI